MDDTSGLSAQRSAPGYNREQTPHSTFLDRLNFGETLNGISRSPFPFLVPRKFQHSFCALQRRTCLSIAGENKKERRGFQDHL